MASVFKAAVGPYTLVLDPSGLPELHAHYLEHARLVEQFEIQSPEGAACFVAVGSVNEPWPTLVVEQRYSPAGHGFNPGVLLAPDTGVLFLGAGTRLLAYQLTEPKRLWEAEADCGFWAWERHGEVALMLAELELAAWSVAGVKLWSLPVEPPWSHRVSGAAVTVEVMGKPTTFPLLGGPKTAT